MFQTHCYDAWLGGSARQSRVFMYSQLGGTFPAPLFLFVAGISFALVTERLWQKNLPPGQIARMTVLRGAEILGLGLLFRVQEFVISWGWAPKSDLLRVDILNTIGVSMMLMGVVCWIVNVWARPRAHAAENLGETSLASPFALIIAASATALLIHCHTFALDYLAPGWVALAAGVLYQRCPQTGQAATCLCNCP